MSEVPDGFKKLPFINQINPKSQINPVLSEEQIASLVAAAPSGTYWYVGGEPNRTSVNGAMFADVFHYYYSNLKKADPEAKITGPSILNWDFTCIGCPGYQQGQIWLAQFVDTYRSRYGQPPPVSRRVCLDGHGNYAIPLGWGKLTLEET